MMAAYRWGGLFLSLLAVAFSGWQMSRLPLWGHLPLLNFVGIWASIVFLALPYYTARGTQNSLLWLATLSGLLLAAAFPPSPMTLLIFFAFVPLLIVERHVTSVRQLTRYAYHAFVVWNILTTYWVSNSAYIAGMVAIWLNSLFMTVPFLLFAGLRRRAGDTVGYLSFMAFWIGWEYLHLRWEISWPWLTLGNTFARQLDWVQWYEYTGVFGGTLWILLLNVAGIYLYKHYTTQRRKWWQLIGLGLLLPILVSYIVLYLFQQRAPVGQSEVAVIQPNYEPHYEKFTLSRDIQLAQCLRLMTKVVTPTTNYVVLPETTFEGYDINAPEGNDFMTPLREFAHAHPAAAIVSGVDAFKIYAAHEPLGKAARYSQRRGVHWENYNVALQLTAADTVPPYYLKSKLVPGPEMIPYRKLFFFVEPIVAKLGGSFAGLGTQPTRSVFRAQTAVAPIICYESIYGEYVTDYIKAGAQLLFIMTNDGWWDNTPGHIQHLQFASLRAIETRRSIARAANTGISGFVSPLGSIIAPTQYGEEAAVQQTLPLYNHITFYTRFGDYIGVLGSVGALCLLLLWVYLWIKQNRNVCPQP